MKDKKLDMDLLIEQSKEGFYRSEFLKEDIKKENEAPEVFIRDDGLPDLFRPLPLAVTCAVTMPVVLGAIILGGGAAAGVALTWLATATIATGSSIYLLYDGLITNADELHDRLMKEINDKESKVDIKGVLSEPYLDSLNFLVNKKDESGKDIIPANIKKELVAFEVKREGFSKGLEELVQAYEVLKLNPNTKKKELNNLEEDLKEILVEFKKEKMNVLDNISDKVEDISKNKYLMTYPDFKKNYEIAQLNDMITLTNNSTIDEINKIYGSNEIKRIEGHVKQLALAMSNGTIEGNEDMKFLSNKINNKINNFSELSLEGKKELLEEYRRILQYTNNYIYHLDGKSKVELNKDYTYDDRNENVNKVIEKIKNNELSFERNI